MPSNDVEVVQVKQASQRKLESMELDIRLTTHKRVVQVKDIESHMLPVFIQSLMYHVPQSVQFSVKPVSFCLLLIFVRLKQ